METSIHNDKDSSIYRDALDNLVIKESIELLDQRMPLDLRGDYRRLIDGAHVPKHRRDKVYEVARLILKDKKHG